MKSKAKSLTTRIALFAFLTVLLLISGLYLWASHRPWLDPAPKGEGSFKEVDSITRQFRKFYRTKDLKFLPKGYVRLEGLGQEGPDGTWLVYYATASHSTVRGGTIGLLDNTGRMDIYFGHHCSSGDGGKVYFREVPGMFGEFFEGVENVRKGFERTFKHQRTEQFAASGVDEPQK